MDPIIKKDSEELNKEFAQWLAAYISEVLRKKSQFTIALSGGTTPKKLYKLLATDYKENIPWSKVHFFWGDERYVPFTDEKNNAKMAFDNLLNLIPVKNEQIHIIQTDISPEKSAISYEKILRRYFPDENETFDLVLLGIGDNAHTLSLFPGYDIIHEKKKWVCSFYLEEQKMFRITLTAPVVNAAECVIFLVSGTDKAAAVDHILENDHEPELYPAQIIQPFKGELYWWLDEAAATDIH